MWIFSVLTMWKIVLIKNVIGNFNFILLKKTEIGYMKANDIDEITWHYPVCSNINKK